MQAFPQRMLGDQPFQFGGERVVPAKRQVSLDQALPGGEPQLVQAGRLGLYERVVGQVREHRAPPRVQGPAEPLPGLRVPSGLKRGQASGQAILEDSCVQAFPAHLQQVAAIPGGQHLRRAATGPGGSSARRRWNTYVCKLVTEASGACPSHTSSTSRSADTTRFAWSSSTASTARCRGPASGTARPDLSTSSGPRIPKASGPVWPAASSGVITHRQGHPALTPPRQRVLTIPSPVRGVSKRALQAGFKAAPSVTRCPASMHNTQEAIMFTRIPRTASQLRTAARQAAARPRRLAAALAAVTCALLASALVPAASAHDLVRDPPGGAPLAPVPAPAAPVTVGGMPGWQIILIAVGAALVTAIAAVFLDRMLAARRSASSTTA